MPVVDRYHIVQAAQQTVVVVVVVVLTLTRIIKSVVTGQAHYTSSAYPSISGNSIAGKSQQQQSWYQVYVETCQVPGTWY